MWHVKPFIFFFLTPAVGLLPRFGNNVSGTIATIDDIFSFFTAVESILQVVVSCIWVSSDVLYYKNKNTLQLWDGRFCRNSSLQAVCDTLIALTGCVSSLYHICIIYVLYKAKLSKKTVRTLTEMYHPRTKQRRASLCGAGAVINRE